jgi:hypothetical protein
MLCDANSPRIISYLSYFLDLILSDFFLFSYIKYYLKGVSFSWEEEFLLEIYEVLMRISSAILLFAFGDWRLDIGDWRLDGETDLSDHI